MVQLGISWDTHSYPHLSLLILIKAQWGEHPPLLLGLGGEFTHHHRITGDTWHCGVIIIWLQQLGTRLEARLSNPAAGAGSAPNPAAGAGLDRLLESEHWVAPLGCWIHSNLKRSAASLSDKPPCQLIMDIRAYDIDSIWWSVRGPAPNRVGTSAAFPNSRGFQAPHPNFDAVFLFSEERILWRSWLKNIVWMILEEAWLFTQKRRLFYY